MHKLHLLVITLFFSVSLLAQQIPLNGVIEHFTNTKCSICASRNPGLLQNVRNHNFHYISIHPSAPYSSCFLSKQNKIQNDARTQHYGVYGSTPRIVVNGYVIDNTFDYSSASVFAPFTTLFTSYKLEIKNAEKTGDTIKYEVTITKTDTSLISKAMLSTMLVEDTIWGNGGNGESEHYHVMRSNFEQLIDLPLLINDSINMVIKHNIQTFWNISRIYPFAMIQETGSNNLLQSAQGVHLSYNTGLNSLLPNKMFVNVYPNPTNNVLYINTVEFDKFELYGNLGVIVKQGTLKPQQFLAVSDLSKGTYLLKVINTSNNENQFIKVLIY